MRLPRVRLRALMIAVAVAAMLLAGMAWVVRQRRIAEGELGKGDLIPERRPIHDLRPDPHDPTRLEPAPHR